jgi:hypothetical protein
LQPYGFSTLTTENCALAGTERKMRISPRLSKRL